MKRCLSLLIVLLFIVAALPLFAQTIPLPSPSEYLGYKLGDRYTPWTRIVDYFDELQKRSPLINVQKFGETYEHRPLMIAVLTSGKNRAASMQGLRENITALANADTTQARANEIAQAMPAVVWLAFGIHGNETSSAEAAMEVASTLLRDPEAQKLLDDTIVIIDPLENPDGRERYVQWFTRTRGAEPDTNPDSFEHSEPWPGGRFNHYLIDMNRDWTWMSQRETQARVELYRQWNPQVFVDFHEMGYNSTYFFPPDAKPVNANLPKEVEKWLDVFGRANAEAFTKKGWPFFVGEVFDLFYPGYGDSWPSLHGAIGMTYEVAGGGRAGSIVEREDNTKYSLADRIARHYTTAMATVRTAAEHRSELLLYTYAAMRAQMAASGNTYLLTGANASSPIVNLLRRNGIQLQALGADANVKATRIDSETAETKTFKAGTIAVSTKQPLGALAQTLLERSPIFAKDFLEEQKKKTSADEPDEFYDLTSWSLPLAMNVETYVTTAPLQLQALPQEPAQPAFQTASYAYLVGGDNPHVYAVAGELLRQGINFSVCDDALQMDNVAFPRGSLLILKGGNIADLDTRLGKLHDKFGGVVAVNSAWTSGASFGSEHFHYVRDPKIALVGGAGTSATSYGMLWHTLDIDTPIPHTNLSLDSFRNVDLSKYRVLVLPDGDYGSRFGKAGVEKLQGWVRGGGTLVAIKGASAFLREKDTDISKIKPWEVPKPKDDKTPVEERYNDYNVPGATFRTTMNERSFLTFGISRPPYVLLEGTTALLPVSHKVDNVVTLTKENPLVAGVAWPESIDRLKGSVYLVDEPYGRGQVITFADEPHYRLFWRGTLPLFLNAILYGPSFPR